MKHEINVLKQLRHENIVRFVGVCTSVRHLCIVTELCENGDLYDYMRKIRKPSFGRLVCFYPMVLCSPLVTTNANIRS